MSVTGFNRQRRAMKEQNPANKISYAEMKYQDLVKLLADRGYLEVSPSRKHPDLIETAEKYLQ